MTLKDLLKKKDKIKEDGAAEKPPTLSPEVPEFTFMRTTTTTQETIEPPSFPGDPTRQPPLLSPAPRGKLGRFRRHSNAASTANVVEENKAKPEHRLFHRSTSTSSVNVPQNLPEVGGDGVARNEEDEAKWEKRATVLVAGNNVLSKSGSTTPNLEARNPLEGKKSRSRSPSISSPADEVCTMNWACRRTEADVWA